MIKIKYIITAVSIIVTTGLKAQDVLELNIEKCRNLAVENSEVIKIADENINKAQGEKKAAKSAYLPNISASATGMYKEINIDQELYAPTQVFDLTTGTLVPNVAVNPLTGETIIGADENPVFNTYAYLPLDLTIQGGVMGGVSAEQPIYAGGKIISGNKMAKIGESLATENRTLKTSEAIYEAENSYYIYLSVKEKVKLAEKYTELLQQLVDVVEDSYEVGMTNQNELLKVKVQYNDAALQKQKAKSGLELARMSLCRVIGVDLNTQVEINDSISSIEFETDNLLETNANQRVEYQLLEKQVEMAEQNVKMIRGDYLPTAGVSVGYNYFNVFLDGSDNYSSHGMNTMASVQIPITTFGERKGKMASAKADFNIKQLELQQATKLLQLEIEQAKFNLIDAYTRVEMTQTTLNQADENLRVSQDNYSLGMETIVNLLEAQAEWQKAFSNKIDALTDFKIKQSNYKRVTNGY